MLRRLLPAAVLCLALSACMMTEEQRVAAYVEDAQAIAERMFAVGSEFETLMTEQPDPLQWSDETVASLDGILKTFAELRVETEGLSVPEALADVHPLLVRSLDDMIAVIDIVRDVAEDPAAATEEQSDEMMAKAESADALANEYVQELERVLAEKFPEMVEE